MKENFVFYAVLVILFSNGTTGCFKDDSVNDRSVTTGSTFYESCCCEENGYTLNDMHWLDPNSSVITGPVNDSNVYIEEMNGCLHLQIRNTSKTLAGPYKCVTTVDGIQHSQVHNLDVFDPLFFDRTKTEQYLLQGKDSLITCIAKGASPPRITWYKGKDGQNEITSDMEKYQILPDGLIVKNVNNDDDGIYKCTASVLSTGEEVEKDIEAKVMTLPVIVQLTASPGPLLVSEEALRIQCSAEGMPTPNYKWKKIPDMTPSDKRNVSQLYQDTDMLIFNSIKPEDEGTYECIAENIVGVSKKQIKITVLTPPEIIDFHNITAEEGTEIPIVCNATGVPIPNIIITYEGKSLGEEKESEYEDVIPNFSLLKVDRSKEGFYICNATNDVDSASVLMSLTVLHRPYFDKGHEYLWAWNGQTVNISCAHDSNPQSNVTMWSFVKGNFSTIETQEHDSIVLDYGSESEHSFPFSEQFAPYGDHACTVQNKYGTATKVYHIRKGFSPSVVENATTIDVTATSATFSIAPPTDYEGPDVIGFVAEYDEADNYDFTNIHPNRTWAIGIPYKLEKLKPNTTYYIKFAAINSVNTGPWSKDMEFDTMDKSAPEPPIWQVNPDEMSSNKVLKWIAAENNGEPIDFYVLRYCPIDDDLDESSCKEHRILEATELDVRDLQHNTTYYLELIAHNSKGNSTAANYTLTIPEQIPNAAPLLSGGVLIGISIVVVLICLVLLDLLLYFWKKQGIIASCCCKKNKKKKPNPLNSRDKKGLLKDNRESGTDDTLKRPNNGHKEYEYNKTTGIITGKHSSV